MADSVQMVLDRDDLLSLPIVGERVRQMSEAMPQARPGGDDLMIAPLSLPRLPARNYFLFEEVCACMCV